MKEIREQYIYLIWHIKSGNLIDHMQKKLCILHRGSGDQMINSTRFGVLCYLGHNMSMHVAFRGSNRRFSFPKCGLFFWHSTAAFAKEVSSLPPSGTKALFGLHILLFRSGPVEYQMALSTHLRLLLSAIQIFKNIQELNWFDLCSPQQEKISCL